MGEIGKNRAKKNQAKTGEQNMAKPKVSPNFGLESPNPGEDYGKQD